MHIRHIYILALAVTLGLLTSACQNESPYYMNSDAELARIQSKIEKLANKHQIDSVSIRSTDRKSLVSSMFLILTKEDSNTDEKTVVEFLPQLNFTMEENSNTKKDALHDHKVDIKGLSKQIETAKTMFPSGYSYRDINAISYKASPFGQSYYFAIEVKAVNPKENNEYVEVFYDNKQVVNGLEGDPHKVGHSHCLIHFRLENGNLEMLKSDAEAPELEVKLNAIE